MFRLLGNLIKLVTMVSTLMVAIDQIRSIVDKKKKVEREALTESTKAA